MIGSGPELFRDDRAYFEAYGSPIVPKKFCDLEPYNCLKKYFLNRS